MSLSLLLLVLVTLLNLAVDPTQAVGVCENGFTQKNNVCYKFFMKKREYHRAKVACSMYSGILAMPKHRDALKDVTEMIPQDLRVKSKVYVGLDDLATNETFFWNDDTPFNSCDPLHGETKDQFNNRQDCIIIWAGKSLWKTDCDHSYFFVCQKAPTCGN